jgi:hypothetical protein
VGGGKLPPQRKERKKKAGKERERERKRERDGGREGSIYMYIFVVQVIST